MNEYLKLQEGLLAWFWFEPKTFRSLQVINSVCTNMYNQYYSVGFSKDAKYQLFYPLLRWGVVEFYGDDKYKLSPTSILYNERFILTCNLPPFAEKKLKTVPIFKNISGMLVYESTKSLISTCESNLFSLRKFELDSLLKEFHSFRSIIQSWDDDTIIDTRNFFLLGENNKWSDRPLKLTAGVYKKSSKVYAGRSLKLSEDQWKTIPTRRYNIDGFNIAAIWSQIYNDWNIGVCYDLNKEILTIRNIFFPIVLERLLCINTLLSGKPHIDICEREYFVQQSTFSMLNKLFKGKIRII